VQKNKHIDAASAPAAKMMLLLGTPAQLRLRNTNGSLCKCDIIIMGNNKSPNFLKSGMKRPRSLFYKTLKGLTDPKIAKLQNRGQIVCPEK
jgi:hypothetical protein